MLTQPGELLSKINSPNDLKKLKIEDLPLLCNELRQFIIDIISKNPGHLGASLGVVELAAALHYAFNTPDDKLIWDVGHQAYAHKILTGRRDVFHTNRMYKGISGFPKMSESEYDSFGTGHSSTSISAALGMAIASAMKGETERHHIAVIGDGSLTAGQAFESLNHAGFSNANLLVIVNDNGIAIDDSVGALKEYLLDITTSKSYNRLKNWVWNFLDRFHRYGRVTRAIVQRLETAIKVIFFRRINLFEVLKFRYFGPVDGHDVIRLTKVLQDLKKIPGPKLLHVITVKGRGYINAEKEQTKFHSPGIFNKDTGEIIETSCEGNAKKFHTVFGHTIIELAEQNPVIVGITPAMSTGCSLNLMMKKMPKRVFDVGIAEQHAVTFSAGLAVQGYTPFCNIYSTFMQRAYDQILHDVALQNIPVIFCLDRAGLVGEDGATHHGSFDLAYLRPIPNMIISAPLNEQELRNLMYTAQLKKPGPFVIRYPRGRGVMHNWKTPFSEIEIGKGQLIREGSDMAIISIGQVGNNVIVATKSLEAEEINIAHYDIRFLKPIDTELLHQIFKNFKKIITVEDGITTGGLGSEILEFMSTHNYKADVIRLGIPDRFVEHGSMEQLQAECGYDKDGIIKAVKDFLAK